MPTMTNASRRKYTKYLLEDAHTLLDAGHINLNEYDSYCEMVRNYSARELFVAYCGAMEVNSLKAARAVANG